MKFSWNGLEDKREEIILAAKKYRDEDKKAEEYYLTRENSTLSTASSMVIGMTVRGMRGKEKNAVGDALKRLMDIHAECVQIHSLSPDFVRMEWAPILNPHPDELERCKKLLAKARKQK